MERHTPQKDLNLFGLAGVLEQVTKSAKSAEQARQALQTFKDGALKSAWRRLARQHHPDAGGDKAKFQEAQGAYERLMSLRIMEPRPRPMAIVINTGNIFDNSSATTTSGTWVF